VTPNLELPRLAGWQDDDLWEYGDDTVKVDRWPADISRWPQQEQFVLDITRYKLWIGGRGCAKTSSAIFSVIQYMAEWPGARILIIAPSFPQLQATTMASFAYWVPQEWVVYQNMAPDKMYMDVLVPGNSEPCRIFWRSATNPNTIRGMEIALSLIDEAADCNPMTIDLLAPCHRQPGFPYQTIITGTPRGFNWMYKRFIDPISRIRPREGGAERAKAYFATTYDNPWLPPDYVHDLEAQYAGNPTLRDQEVLGKFVSFQGMVFPALDYDTHRKMPPCNIKDFVVVEGGSDFGLSDPSTIVLVGKTSGGKFWAFREYYKPKANGNEVMAAHAEFQGLYHVSRFWADAHAKTEIRTLRANGIRVRKGLTDIGTRIRTINAMLAGGPGGPRLYISPECPNLWTEMSAYSYGSKFYGDDIKYADAIPENQPNHAIDPLGYALTGMLGRSGQSDFGGVIFG